MSGDPQMPFESNRREAAAIRQVQEVNNQLVQTLTIIVEQLERMQERLETLAAIDLAGPIMELEAALAAMQEWREERDE